MKNIVVLKNVSKFYYSKGVIASGFNKVNLSFKLGEFVAITGESGSGKSTLLNVISGLDTYEEGEMYINGDETSHYTEKDFEDYRRKYIGNIFQNFNLVNSYTVYQNIELVLLLNGNKKKDVKNKVLDLIKTVDLYKFRNTKVSKLSGGQKQRVAIARALAKDTPVIIADEPTGNLDTRSANSIIKLLSEIAKDKLVIIVTHNYEQVEKYVTRKIKMHDGKVLEDKEIIKVDEVKNVSTANYNNITFLNKIRLGVRNTFNIIPKFLLVLMVYLFVTISLMSEYASFKNSEYEASKEGYNNYFNNLSDTRVILKKQDKSTFIKDDYDKLLKVDNVKEIYKNDLLLDTVISVTDDNNYWINGSIISTKSLDGSLALGRMPENDDEIVIMANENDYYVGYQGNELIDKELYIQNINTGNTDKNLKLKVVGIKYNENNYNYDTTIYLSDAVIGKLEYQINQKYSTTRVKFQGIYHNSNSYDSSEYAVVVNNNVPAGEAYMTEDYNYMCPKENCLNQALDIKINNLYYDAELNLKITKLYTKKNINQLLGLTENDYDMLNGTIYVNPSDYDSLYNKGNYQASIFVDDVNKIDDTVSKLNDLGYTTLKIKDTIVGSNVTEAIQLFKAVVTIILVIVLFFITYFVIRIILKSRNVYFSTIRMLGATKKISKQLLIIELLTVSNLAYFGFMIFVYLNKLNLFNVKFINTIITYMTLKDYIILYVILILLSYLVSQKFAKKLFKNSAISTIKEEN